jgi:2-dehydropantoate 2-reductase
MKIAVVGCGAVGGFYGGKLAHSGHQAHFLLRSDYDAVRRNGVLIHSPQGDFRIHPACARAPEEIGVSDLVLIGLKTTANDQFANLLPPLVGPSTAVLTLQNGLGNEEALAQLISPEATLGGLCFVCLNRIEPGVIRHIDHGKVVLGEFQRPPQPRTHLIAEYFRQAGISCSVSENLALAHWEKLVWNVPFNGLGVASAAGYEGFVSGKLPSTLQPCLTTDKLLSDSSWEGLVRDLMLEVIAAARALGFNIPDSLADHQIERTRTMGAYKASTLIDFERGQPLELHSLFLEPLRQAQASGANTPRLQALCHILCQLDAQRAPATASAASPV